MGMNDIFWTYNSLTITTRLSQSGRKKVKIPSHDSAQRVRASIETTKNRVIESTCMLYVFLIFSVETARLYLTFRVKTLTQISFNIESRSDWLRPTPVLASLLEMIFPLSKASSVGTALITNLSHSGLSSSLILDS